MHVQVRIPGATNFVQLFGQFANSIALGNSTAAIAATAQERGMAILNTIFKGNATELKRQYWSSIVSGPLRASCSICCSRAFEGQNDLPDATTLQYLLYALLPEHKAAWRTRLATRHACMQNKPLPAEAPIADPSSPPILGPNQPAKGGNSHHNSTIILATVLPLACAILLVSALIWR